MPAVKGKLYVNKYDANKVVEVDAIYTVTDTGVKAIKYKYLGDGKVETLGLQAFDHYFLPYLDTVALETATLTSIQTTLVRIIELLELRNSKETYK